MSKTDLVPVEPLKKQVDNIKDTRVREKCQAFLNEFDLRNIQSFRQLQSGYQGLLYLAGALGNQSEAVRSNLNLMTRILDSYSRVLKTYIECEFPRDIKKALEEIFSSLDNKLPPEDMDRIRTIIDGI